MACSQLVGLGEVGPDFFGLEGEFVVEELVEKDLGDDLEFVAVVAQAIGGADALEAVDQLTGSVVQNPVLPRVCSVLLPA